MRETSTHHGSTQNRNGVSQRHGIDVRHLDRGCFKKPEISITLVIGHDDDAVGPLPRTQGHGSDAGQQESRESDETRFREYFDVLPHPLLGRV